MNPLAVKRNTIVNLDTLDEKGRIRIAVAWDPLSENTKMAYQKAYKRLDSRGVVVEDLTDESLALCISQLDADGLSPATLSLTVAAVQWYFKHINSRAARCSNEPLGCCHEMRSPARWTTTDKRLLTIKRDTENRGNGKSTVFRGRMSISCAGSLNLNKASRAIGILR